MPNAASHNLPLLFQRIHDGDEKAFDTLFALLYPSLCIYCDQYTHDKAIAQHIASEALLNLWIKRDSIREPQYLKTFLYRTARNMCLNWLAQQNRKHTHEVAAQYLDEKETSPIIDSIIRAEVAQHLHTAIQTLPPQCSRIFQMIYFHGKSPKEVAEELRLSVSTVYNQQAYGLSLLRKRLGNLFTVAAFAMIQATENYFSGF